VPSRQPAAIAGRTGCGRELVRRAPRERERQPGAGDRFVQGVAEHVMELAHAIAHGLRVHVQLGGDRLAVAEMTQPAGQRFGEPLAHRRRDLVEWGEDAAAQRRVEPGVPVHDDRVEVLVGKDWIFREQTGALQRRGHLGDLYAHRQVLQRHRVTDDRAGATEEIGEPLPTAGPGRVRDDRAEHRAPANEQARIIQPGQHALRESIVFEQDNCDLLRQRPPGTVRGRAYGRGVGPIGQQELDELVAEAFPSGDRLGLLDDETARRCGRQPVDEDEHGLGQGGQAGRCDADVQRRLGHVVPGDTCAELIRRQQRGELAALLPLHPADFLEQLDLRPEFGAVRERAGRRLGDFDQHFHESLGRHDHFVLLDVEELGVIGPFLAEQLPNFDHDGGQPVDQGGHQPLQLGSSSPVVHLHLSTVTSTHRCNRATSHPSAADFVRV
jgi:hypothetical protein